MNIKTLLVVDDKLFIVKESPNDACEGCALEPSLFDETCRYINCTNQIFVEAGLREVVEILATANKEK